MPLQPIDKIPPTPDSPEPAIKAISPEVPLEEAEEREIGAVSWSAYTGYFRAMGNPLWAVLIFGSLILGQLANVANSLMLGFWSGESIPNWGPGAYMGVYAGFGLIMAICTVSFQQIPADNQ